MCGSVAQPLQVLFKMVGPRSIAGGLSNRRKMTETNGRLSAPSPNNQTPGEAYRELKTTADKLLVSALAFSPRPGMEDGPSALSLPALLAAADDLAAVKRDHESRVPRITVNPRPGAEKIAT